MLGKLMKYEFRATARLMTPLLLLVLLLGAGIGVGINFPNLVHASSFGNLTAALVLIAYVIAVIASMVCAVVLMVQRFSKNLMGDEGYLTNTLPVSQHQLIWAKLLTSLIWFLAVALVNILALLFISFSGDMKELFDSFAGIWQQLMENHRGKTFLVIGELALLSIVSVAAICLQFYGAISFGYSFAKHKGLLSVVAFFVLGWIESFFSNLVAVVTDRTGMWLIDANLNVEATVVLWSSSQKIIWLMVGMYLIFAAALYVLTWLMMKKRLNLQ